MKKILTLVIALNLLTSCSGDDIPGTTTSPENNTVLLRHYSSEINNSTYNWDIEYEGNRMMKLKSIESPIIQDYIYTDNLLTKIKTSNTGTIDYELVINYNQDGKMSKNTIFERGEDVWKNEITYPSENTFVEATNIQGATHTSTTTYTLLNRNITKEKITDSRQADYHKEYIHEYDTKNAPKKNVAFSDTFQAIRFDNHGEYGNNNRIKTTVYIQDEIVAEYTYQYTYNANNYPLTKKIFTNGECVETITYSYE